MRILLFIFLSIASLESLYGGMQAPGGLFKISSKSGFLKPSEAFRAKAEVLGDSVAVTIELGEKIHLYAKDLRFSLTAPVKKRLDVKLPPAVKWEQYDVYYGKLSLRIPLELIRKYTEGDFTLRVDMAGCSDAGICYQPQKFTFDLNTGNTPQQTRKADSTDRITDATNKKSDPQNKSFISRLSKLASGGNSASIAKALAGESVLFILLLFFAAGLMLAMTPCILPMIPILSSIIINQSGRDANDSGRSRAFVISAVYVLAMAATYAAIGVIAGLLGFDIQAQMNNPWIMIPLAAVFAALAFSLFGYFDLALPSSWQNRLTAASDSARGKGLLGTAVMGSLSALIVGTCTAPVISGAVIFISMTGNAVLGGISLFAMGIGAGMPLLLVGAGAEKFIPKPGGWMTKVSRVFGVIMLAIALYVLRGIMPEQLYMTLFSALLIGSAVFMDVFGSGERTVFEKIVQVFAFILLIYGAMLLIGAISGSDSVTDPLKPFTQSQTGQRSTVDATFDISDKISKRYTLKRLKSEITASRGRPVIVDISRKNCAACSELEHITFSDPKVREEMKRFKFIHIDITSNSDDDRKILDHYRIFGAPNLLFFDSEGKALEEKFLTGFITPAKFLKHISDIR